MPKKLTRVPRRIVPELMTAIKRRPHANPASRCCILLPHEPQFGLQLVGVVRVASIRRLEEGSGIAAFRHEHLDGIVDVGFLRLRSQRRLLDICLSH